MPLFCCPKFRREMVLCRDIAERSDAVEALVDRIEEVDERAKNALLKFQKFPMKKTLYESFYPVPERGKAASCRRPHPAGRDGARGVRNSNLSRLRKICTRQNCYPNFPLLKVFEILKNFFQEVFKQGLGQSPKVLNNLTRNGTTRVSFRISQQLTSYHFYPVAEKA